MKPRRSGRGTRCRAAASGRGRSRRPTSRGRAASRSPCRAARPSFAPLGLGQRHVGRWAAEVPVPLGHLVAQDHVVAPDRRGQLSDHRWSWWESSRCGAKMTSGVPEPCDRLQLVLGRVPMRRQPPVRQSGRLDVDCRAGHEVRPWPPRIRSTRRPAPVSSRLDRRSAGRQPASCAVLPPQPISMSSGCAASRRRAADRRSSATVDHADVRTIDRRDHRMRPDPRAATASRACCRSGAAPRGVPFLERVHRGPEAVVGNGEHLAEPGRARGRRP